MAARHEPLAENKGEQVDTDISDGIHKAERKSGQGASVQCAYTGDGGRRLLAAVAQYRHQPITSSEFIRMALAILS